MPNIATNANGARLKALTTHAIDGNDCVNENKMKSDSSRIIVTPSKAAFFISDLMRVTSRLTTALSPDAKERKMACISGG